jgi:hypothetical protein
MSLQIYGAAGSIHMEMHPGKTRIKLANGDTEELSAGEETYPVAAPSAHLVTVARGAEPPLIIEAGWRAVELLDAAYRSAEENGRPVTASELYET